MAVIAVIRVIQQFEQGIVFRFGRVLPEVRGPGLTVLRPFADRLVKVNMQIVAMAVPGQDGITRDNVSVRVDAVVYFRVVDSVKAVVNVQNYMYAVSQVAQTSLRSVIGKSDLDDLLSNREKINAELAKIIDEPTEGPWGIRIERVEIKDVALPETMKRSMSRQAEAERERRARVIAADGEFQASKRLAAAAQTMSADPASLQLRLLQTVVDVAAEKNSTLVMPFPVEVLRFFEKFSGGPPDAGDSASRQAEEPAGEPEPPELESTPEIPPVPDVPDVPGTAESPDVAEAPGTAEAPEAPATAEAPEAPGTAEAPEAPPAAEAPEVSSGSAYAKAKKQQG